MTPDEIADEITDLEMDLEEIAPRILRLIPGMNMLARKLNLDGKEVRACDCDCIDNDLGESAHLVVAALCALKRAHQGMIQKAGQAPIPLPQPKSGR